MRHLYPMAAFHRVFFWAVCLLCGSHWTCYMPSNVETGRTPPFNPNAPAIGGRASSTVSSLPDFSLKTLNGETVNSQDYDQKVLVVNFWATWCPPCVQEIPHLNDLYSDFRSRGVEILGISMDTGDADIVRRFIRRHGMKYSVVLADSEVGDAFGGVYALPATFIVDQQGEIVKRYDGFRPSYVKDTRRTIDQLLG